MIQSCVEPHGGDYAAKHVGAEVDIFFFTASEEDNKIVTCSTRAQRGGRKSKHNKSYQSYGIINHLVILLESAMRSR